MNVVDSSGWLEYFTDGPNADFFAVPIQDTKQLVVPVSSIVEVYSCIARQRGEGDALQAIAAMQEGTVADLTVPVALESARLSLEDHIPLADCIVLATARTHRATLWTQNPNLKNLEYVRYVDKNH